MTVETLAAFRTAAEGMNVQPVLIVTKDENGNLIVAKSDPATGALVVEATVATVGLATEVTLAAIKAVLDTQLDVALSSLAADATVQAGNNQMSAINKGFFFKPYDELSANYSGATTDVWTSKLATVTQQVLTITYADSTKAQITNVKVV